MRGKTLLTALAAGAALGVFGLAGPAPAAETIKLGSYLSVTGPASFLGAPEKKVLEHYVEQFNKAGGVAGRKIELIIYDDGGAPDKATSFAKRLIENDKVDLIVGGSTTATTMAAVPLVEAAGVPFLNLAGAVIAVEPAKKWVFKTPHTDRMAAEKVFADMKKRGITRIAMISENAGFGKSGHDQSLLVMANYGIQLVADETYAPRDPDVTAQLTKIKNTAGVQAVFNWSFGQSPAIVAKNYRQLGITLPLYMSHGVSSKEFITLAGAAAEGIRLPAAGIVVADQLPATDIQKNVAMDFKKTYEGKYKEEVSSFGGHAYDALMIALAAIQRANSIDKGKVRDEIEKTKGYVGTGGTVNMSPTDHMGLDLTSFHMVDVKNGNFVLNN
ncbi:MAG: ABC transporter substrate-binding protein [Rhodospirillales bacterium]|nr:ABC transporter substrate-binding protein [Rhodospirillales bacterium]